MIKQNITIIGIGNMGKAFAKAFLNKGIVTKNNLVLSSQKASSMQFFKRKYGIQTTTDNKKASRNADILILTVKPNQIKDVIVEIREDLKLKTIIISVAAGIPIKNIEKWLKKKQGIIRIMPNTPAQIGQGMTVWTTNHLVTTNQKRTVKLLLSTLGDEMFVKKESVINQATAISGSGPAYFYYLTETLIKAGIAIKLTPKQATQLAIKTFIGSSELLKETEKKPLQLRQAVTSKGGTTEAALESFKKNHFKETIQKAVEAANQRATILSQKTL